MDNLGNLIKKNQVLIFSTSDCKYTEDVQNIFRSLNVAFHTVLLDSLGVNRLELENEIYSKTTEKTMPVIFVNSIQITGIHSIRRYLEDGSLEAMLDGRFRVYDYDLLVIGGGSAGLTAAQEAANLGAAVVICDFVPPTPHGTTWGLGGTCVNVGCVAKKLMQMGAIIGEDLKEASFYGWNLQTTPFHNWNTLVFEVQNYIRSVNYGYRKSLKECGVVYWNVSTKFVNANTVRIVSTHGGDMVIRAKEFIIATGGKPAYMDIPGAKHAITSDDIFSLPYHPGKVIIVGASFVALECAGFLNAFGVDTTVCVRHKVLGKYDQQMAELMVKHMSSRGVKFMRHTVVTSIKEKISGKPGTYEVTLTIKGGDKIIETCNTILFAIGRTPNTQELGLDEAGVKVNPDTGCILVNERDQTSAPHIYAVGDVCEGRQHFTPVAIQTAKYLVRRLYGNEDTLTDHTFIPSTVFTPLEYGFIGLSEEEAKQKYGLGDVKVYYFKCVPSGYCLAPLVRVCYGKIICIKSNNERVFGFHICGPNAGEVTQGFALAMKMGARKNDFYNMFAMDKFSCAFANAYNKHKSIAKEDKPNPRDRMSSTSKPRVTASSTSKPRDRTSPTPSSTFKDKPTP